jgi:hypothetical protein
MPQTVDVTLPRTVSWFGCRLWQSLQAIRRVKAPFITADICTNYLALTDHSSVNLVV